MAGQTTRNLFLQVGADVSPLTAQVKVGRSALLNLSDAANDVASQVEKAFQGLGGGKISTAAKDIERSFDNTFANIRRNAAAVMQAPTGKAALQILDIAGVEQAAAAAETQAAALRRNADAAALVAQRAGATGDAERVLAVGFEVAAQQAEKQAVAMRAQAAVVGSVAAEVRAKSLSDVAANDEVVRSHNRMGNSGLIAEHVVRSLSDSIAAGQSPARALGMEMGRITEAMAMFAQTTDTEGTGKLAKFASFMGGPWGLAVSVGTAVLVPLISHLFEMGSASEDAMQKLKDEARATDANREAKEQFRRTQEGVTQAINAGTDAVAKSIENQRSEAERVNINTRAYLAQEVAIRQATVARLEDARSRLAADTTRSQGGGQRGELGGIAAAQDQAQIGGITLSLAAETSKLAQAQSNYENSRVDLAAETAKREADPIARIKKLYDDKALAAENAARREIAAGQNVTAALTANLARIDRERKAGVEAEQERERIANRKPNDRQVGRQIDLGQAEDIIHGIGGRITSSTRTRDQQQGLYDRYQAYKAGTGPWAPLAAKPGTSEHESGQALDIAMGGGMSLAKIRAAFEKNGVRITELLNEGDHFHVAWGKKGPSQETLEKREQAAADKRTRDSEAYTQLLGSAREDQLKLARGQTTSISAAADLDVQAVEVERSRLASAANAGVAERRGTQAQADALNGVYQRNANLKVEDIRQKEGQQLLDEQLSADRDQLDRSTTLLQLQSDLADTVSARKAIALQLLANQEQQARDAAIKLIGSDNPDDQAKGDAALRAIDETHPLRANQINRQFQNPMDTYREQLTGNVKDMGRALDGVKADGLKGVEDGLVGILSGTKSVAQGFRDMADKIIADLARIAVEKLILSVIGLKDGGAIPGFSSGGIPGFAFGGAPWVDRGVIRGPGTGTSDSILAAVSGRGLIRVANGEGIVNERGMRKYRAAFEAINADRLPAFADGGAIDGSRIFMRAVPNMAAIARPAPAAQVIYVQVDKSQLFDAHVTRLAAPLAQAAMVGGAAQAQQDLADRQMAAIP